MTEKEHDPAKGPQLALESLRLITTCLALAHSLLSIVL